MSYFISSFFCIVDSQRNGKAAEPELYMRGWIQDEKGEDSSYLYHGTWTGCQTRKTCDYFKALFLITCSMSVCSDVSSLMLYLARIFMMGLIFSHHWVLGMRCLWQTEYGLYHLFNIRCSWRCILSCGQTDLTQNRCPPSGQREAGRWAPSSSCPAHRLSLACWQRCDRACSTPWASQSATGPTWLPSLCQSFCRRGWECHPVVNKGQGRGSLTSICFS